MRSRRTTTRISSLVTAGVLAVLLAGCSSSPSTPTSSPSTSAASTQAASTQAASTQAASTQAASTQASAVSSSANVSRSQVISPSGSGLVQPTTLVGTLAAGVEGGCVVLLDDRGTVLANLMGLDQAAAPLGSTVQVEGRFETDLVTT
jgi:glucose/arabinose dehydrogenase